MIDSQKEHTSGHWRGSWRDVSIQTVLTALHSLPPSWRLGWRVCCLNRVRLHFLNTQARSTEKTSLVCAPILLGAPRHVGLGLLPPGCSPPRAPSAQDTLPQWSPLAQAILQVLRQTGKVS